MSVVTDLPAADPFAQKLAGCQQRIEYWFREAELLVAALTHASGADHRLASNERLEFLGDAILGAVVCEMLYRRFPDFLEGDLTKIKSVVVSRKTCAKISRGLRLEEFLILGKGMSTHVRLPSSLMSNLFEALVAAIYLDGGHDAVRPFIERHLEPEIDEAAGQDAGDNYKSQLQQLVQRNFAATPTYHLMDEKGPDHSKCFKISAQVQGDLFPAAWGRSKKEAEQRAASNALCYLRGEEAPFPAE